MFIHNYKTKMRKRIALYYKEKYLKIGVGYTDSFIWAQAYLMQGVISWTFWNRAGAGQNTDFDEGVLKCLFVSYL